MNTFVLCNISKKLLAAIYMWCLHFIVFFFLIPLDIRNWVALACFIIASVLFWIFWREASFTLSSRCILKLCRHPRVAASRVTCVVGHQSKCLAIHLLGCSILHSWCDWQCASFSLLFHCLSKNSLGHIQSVHYPFSVMICLVISLRRHSLTVSSLYRFQIPSMFWLKEAILKNICWPNGIIAFTV